MKSLDDLTWNYPIFKFDISIVTILMSNLNIGIL